jgi:DNA polymerase III delta prime subunit
MDTNSLPLTEKYRITKLEDLIGNKNQVIFLKKFIECNRVPNLIINGNTGCGKTSAVIAFAKEYLGDLYNDYCMELNASDDRGIDAVRSKIKIFSQRKMSDHRSKIIILDESDNMTIIAQLALKRLIEQYSDTTRFFFTCNNIENIISGIQSCCKIMYFGKIEKDDMIMKLREISLAENMEIDDEAMEMIISLTENKSDMREMINKLELLKANYSHQDAIKITTKEICNICDKPSPIIIQYLLKILGSDLKEGIQIIHNLKNDGFQSSDICITLTTEILNMNILEIKKKDLITCISEYNRFFLEGNDSLLQMGGLVIEIYKILRCI